MRPMTSWLHRLSVGALGGLALYVVVRRIREQLGAKTEDASKAPEPESLLITEAQVAQHCSTEDCWIIIDGAVYDVTNFALSHPGGPELVYQCAGRDATMDFLSVHPPEYAWEYVGPAIGRIETQLPKEMPPAGLPRRLDEGLSCKKLRHALQTKVLTVTGGFGAMVQRYMREEAPLAECDYRSCDELQSHPEDLLGNHDVLALTRPDVVKWVYRRSMEGCNIVGTSTFNTQSISQEEYGISGDLIYKMAKQSTELAQQVRSELELKSGLQSRFVGGQIGPTTKTACVAVDVADPSVRNTCFDELSAAYGELVAGMVDGGVDVVMVDCAFDTLNVKAALYAAEQVMVSRGRRLPVMVSMSLVDDSGRTLSGQTIEAFYASIRHARPFTVGFNCGAGPAQMARYLSRLSGFAECFTHAYPNAGLPNAEGCYDLEPEPMAAQVSEFARERLSNVVGGCCGAGPHHLSAITDKVASVRAPPALRIPSDTNNGGHFDRSLYPPGVSIPARRPRFLLSGTEELAWREGGVACALVVQRVCSLTRLESQATLSDLQGPGWRERGEAEALQRLRSAASEEGVGMLGLDFSMRRRGSTSGAWDDEDVVRFANLVQGEPEVSTMPLLIRVEPLDAAGQATLVKILKCLQGRSLVDIGPLLRSDQGASGLGFIPDGFVKVLNEIRSLGNSVLVDAPSSDLRGSVRGFELLGFAPDEIVFAVPAGHVLSKDDVARGLVTAVRLLDNKALPPLPNGVAHEVWAAAVSRALTSSQGGGAALVITPPCPSGILQGATTAARAAVAGLFTHSPQHGDRGSISNSASKDGIRAELSSHNANGSEPSLAPEQSSLALQRCVEHGVDSGLADAVRSAMAAGQTVDSLINGPLMAAMRRVSDSYSSGGSSLPQVLKSSRVLKLAVSALQAAESNAGNAAVTQAAPRERVGEKVVLATVKGDVHDLGKTIVGILLRCNGYHVVDLGRNVELDAIADEALGGQEGRKAAMIGMSGMISPSLGRMVEGVKILRDRGIDCPVLVGGSATSSAFCALFLDTLRYPGGVFRIADGPRTILAASALLRSAPAEREEWVTDQQDKYQEVREEREAVTEHTHKLLSLSAARDQAKASRLERFPMGWAPYRPRGPVSTVVEEAFTLAEVLPLVNWTYFFQVFNLQGRHPHHTWPSLLQDPDTGSQARSLQGDLDRLVAEFPTDTVVVKCVHALLPAKAVGDDLHILSPRGTTAVMPLLRQQTQKCLSLSDFVSADDGDHIALFACASHVGDDREPSTSTAPDDDDYEQVLRKALAARLVEAGAELWHQRLRRRWFEEDATLSPAEMMQEKYQGIRPAVGYPSIPDQRVMGVVWELLGMKSRREQTGMWVTESFGLSPEASIAGIALSHPASSYFSIGRASREQIQDYAQRCSACLHSGSTPNGPGPAGDDAKVAEAEKWLAAVMS